MCKATENAHKTAINRSRLSSPAQYLVDNGLLQGRCLDYGCGKGFDCDELHIEGYDPYYRDQPLKHLRYETIMCNFVLNVLPQHEWSGIIDNILALLEWDGIAYISVRNDKKNLNGFTSRDTYQTFVELDLPVVKKTSNFVMYRLEKQ